MMNRLNFQTLKSTIWNLLRFTMMLALIGPPVQAAPIRALSTSTMGHALILPSLLGLAMIACFIGLKFLKPIGRDF